MRIGVLGANGQVGAEVCLLLSQQAGVEVVPICRNRFGSAFLRYSGLACRHGDPADPEQASRLYGDCELVADFSLASLVPDYRLAQEIHNRLIRNVAQYAKPSAKYIYFSTQSVYGDAHVHQNIVFQDIYGHEKYRCEGLVRNYAAQYGREAYIFRLGHVCGEFQGITRNIREAIAYGPVPVPDLNRASNTVHVVTIVDAILKVANDQAQPGTYDLMNVPQWSWKEVFEYEGGKMGIEPKFQKYIEKKAINPAHFLHITLMRALRGLVESRVARKLSSRLLPILPADWNRRIKAAYSIKSTAAEIAKLHPGQEPMDAVLFKPVVQRFLGTLPPTVELLADPKFNLSDHDKSGCWPEDIPFASAQTETYENAATQWNELTWNSEKEGRKN
jgi:nucleoside-diphosphate-sugar epimerase